MAQHALTSDQGHNWPKDPNPTPLSTRPTTSTDQTPTETKTPKPKKGHRTHGRPAPWPLSTGYASLSPLKMWCVLHCCCIGCRIQMLTRQSLLSGTITQITDDTLWWCVSCGLGVSRISTEDGCWECSTVYKNSSPDLLTLGGRFFYKGSLCLSHYPLQMLHSSYVSMWVMWKEKSEIKEETWID